MREGRKGNDCGNCRHWVRRDGRWGNCHKNAPTPYPPGPFMGSYFPEWEKTLNQQRNEKQEGKKPDWEPPKNWRTVWPDTNATDYCGDFIKKGK